MKMLRGFQRVALLQRGGAPRQMRWSSTQPPPAGEKVVSPHVGFYKTFSRPIIKVLLMATFTYQLVYWGWVKLEKDEIMRTRRTEIEDLERELVNLTKKVEG